MVRLLSILYSFSTTPGRVRVPAEHRHELKLKSLEEDDTMDCVQRESSGDQL